MVLSEPQFDDAPHHQTKQREGGKEASTVQPDRILPTFRYWPVAWPVIISYNKSPNKNKEKWGFKINPPIKNKDVKIKLPCTMHRPVD